MFNIIDTMCERDIQCLDKKDPRQERSESEIRRRIAIVRAEIKESRWRCEIYKQNKHNLDVVLVCIIFIFEQSIYNAES